MASLSHDPCEYRGREPTGAAQAEQDGGRGGRAACRYASADNATTVSVMSSITTSPVTVITLAYDPAQAYRMTHICEEGFTFCDKDTAAMQCFETAIRGRRSLEDFVDCIQCCREMRSR